MRGRFYILFSLALVTGCGGGGGGSSPGPTPTVTPTVAASPTPAPTGSSTPVASSTQITIQPGAFSVPLSPAGSLSATLGFTGMQAAPNTVLTAGLTSNGASALSSARRLPAASGTPIFELTLAATNGLLIGPDTTATFDLGPAASGLAAVEIQVIDDANNTSVVGVFDVVNDSVTIQIPQSISIAPGTLYTIEAFIAPSGATPTPIQPTPAPGTIDTTLSTSQSSAVLIGSTGGYAGIFEVPPVTTSGSCSGSPVLTGTYGNSPPAGAPAFTGVTGGTDFYLQLTSSCSIVPSGAVDFALTAPSGGLGVAELANGTYGPVTGITIVPFGTAPNGDTNFDVDFPIGTFSLQAGVPVTFVFYPQSSP